MRVGRFAPKAACARAASSGEGGDTSNCPARATAVGSSAGVAEGSGEGVEVSACAVNVGVNVDACAGRGVLVPHFTSGGLSCEMAGGGSSTDPQAARRRERKRRRRTALHLTGLAEFNARRIVNRPVRCGAEIQELIFA